MRAKRKPRRQRAAAPAGSWRWSGWSSPRGPASRPRSSAAAPGGTRRRAISKGDRGASLIPLVFVEPAPTTSSPSRRLPFAGRARARRGARRWPVDGPFTPAAWASDVGGDGLERCRCGGCARAVTVAMRCSPTSRAKLDLPMAANCVAVTPGCARPPCAAYGGAARCSRKPCCIGFPVAVHGRCARSARWADRHHGDRHGQWRRPRPLTGLSASRRRWRRQAGACR